MESLDELLADLHSATTTNTIKSEPVLAGHSPTQPYQGKLNSRDRQIGNEGDQYYGGGSSPRAAYMTDYKQTSQLPLQRQYVSGDRLSSNSSHSRRDSDRYSVDSGASGDILPPPLPPHPSQDIIDEASAGYTNEPLYEPQNVVQMGGNNHTSSGFNVGYVEQYDSSSMGHRGAGDPAASQSTLGANLNELDYLLQDLNSAQFLNDMSRSTSDNSVNSAQSPSSRIPPPTMPKPANNKSPRSPQANLYTGGSATSAADTGHASSATRELEDLMDSLSQFKVSPPPQVSDDPPYAKVDKPPSASATPTTPSKPSELDNMLGNLESDMRGHGASVSTKGLCGACAKPVVGQVITALGRIWHPAHFCCYSCKDELGTKSFFERDEMPYCEECYHRLFAPLCGKCSTPILDKCVTAMDTTWHMECFVCEHCGRMLNDEGFHEREGRPYCRNDYFDMFAPKCGGCGLPIIEDFISTLNTQWHTQCFRCKECGVTLAGGSFYDHDGLPYCETHYYAKRGSLCAGCQKPITGRCITAMFRKFHPEHFTCAFCLKQLNKGTFKEQNDKPYCHPCFVKLFA